MVKRTNKTNVNNTATATATSSSDATSNVSVKTSKKTVKNTKVTEPVETVSSKLSKKSRVVKSDLPSKQTTKAKSSKTVKTVKTVKPAKTDNVPKPSNVDKSVKSTKPKAPEPEPEPEVEDTVSESDTSDDSVFNKNAVKRLVCIAGIPRMGNDVSNCVNNLVMDWADTVLDKARSFLEFTGHKTLNVADLQFLSEHYPNLLTPFLAPSSFSVTSCKKGSDLEKVLKGKQHGNVFTAKRTFDSFIHERLTHVHTTGDGPVIRLGNNEANNTMVLLQLLAEEYIVNTFCKARLRMGSRDTVTASDVNAVAVF